MGDGAPQQKSRFIFEPRLRLNSLSNLGHVHNGSAKENGSVGPASFLKMMKILSAELMEPKEEKGKRDLLYPNYSSMGSMMNA